ncbi:cytidine deaminase-like protein [Flammula alnicola]|nr:cytidine deaminase-like protein [Flammula alnicola]
MFVAIVGTRFSGKSSIENYLISSKGFTSVRIIQSDSDLGGFEEKFEVLRSGTSLPLDIKNIRDFSERKEANVISKHLSFLSMSPLPSPAPTTTTSLDRQTLCFPSAADLLKYVTENWRENFVTADLSTRELIDPFIRRPFFFLLSSDAPLLERYKRSKSFLNISLEDFIREDDRIVFGDPHSTLSKAASLQNLGDLVNIQVINSHTSLQGLYSHLDHIDLLHPEHLRPSWDAYFMTLASLASRRSNCMKRRVGAILVRENRVLATGYNGTPRGLTNCNEGGCSHCNGTLDARGKSEECLCLHAEENALLEAGRERVGNDCVLYCNTCPCLKCTVKIIQTGVKTVVYNLTYKVDDASASLFKEAGVQLRRYDPNSRFRLLPAEDEGLVSVTSEVEFDRDTIT